MHFISEQINELIQESTSPSHALGMISDLLHFAKSTRQIVEGAIRGSVDDDEGTMTCEVFFRISSATGFVRVSIEEQHW